MKKRPAWQLIALLLLLFAAVVAFLARDLLVRAPIAEAVRIEITGLPRPALEKLGVFGIVQDGGREVQRIPGTAFWSFRDPAWIGGVFFKIAEKDLGQLDHFIVSIGDGAAVSVPGSDIRRRWRQEPAAARLPRKLAEPTDLVLWIPNEFGRSTSLPWVPGLLAIKTPLGSVTPMPWNWPGDAVYVRALLQNALLPGLLIFFVGFFAIMGRSDAGRDWIDKTLGSEPRQDTATCPPRCPTCDWAGLLAVIAALVFLEVREPYYFTQDDNLIESLPMVLVGCRDLWRGVFPEYNPYIYMGSPLASLGMYALTYPPLPLSYGVARFLLGQEYATFEVFAILHLLAGFVLIRMLGRKLGMGTVSANLTALCCVLSGSALIMGRCWFNFVPVFVWMPAMLLGLVRLRQGPVTWKWALGVGIAAGMPFHVGFTQMAIYMNGFFCLGLLYLLATRTLGWRRGLAAAAALLIGAGLALPLAYQQWLFGQDVVRHVSSEKGIGVGLPAMLLPYPLVEATLPDPIGSKNLRFQGEFYFFGGLLAVLFFFQLVGLLFQRPGKDVWPGQVWTVLGVTALWLGLGESGGLWQLTKTLPVIGAIQRHPLRLMPFIVIFMSLSGGLVLERILAQYGRRRSMEWGTALLVLMLLAWHIGECRTAFYSFGFRPYPKLPDAWRSAFAPNGELESRVSSWANHRSTDANFGLLLPHDIPAVYGLATVDGYAPLLGGKPQVLKMIGKLREDPLPALRAYGIRWHLSHAPTPPGPTTPASSVSWIEEVISKRSQFREPPDPEKFPAFDVADGVMATRLEDVSPMAFAVTEPDKALPISADGGGISVDVSSLRADTRVIVNFLFYPNLRAAVDDRPVRCVADSWYRIEVAVPRGSQRLTIRYQAAWSTGLWLGLAAFAAGCLLMWQGARNASKG